MTFFKDYTIRILLLVAPAAHAFCQESTLTPDTPKFQVTLVSEEEFSECSQDSDLTAEYCAGFGKNGFITIAVKNNQIGLNLAPYNGSLLFGTMQITSQKEGYEYKNDLFPHIIKQLEMELTKNDKDVPEHITISNYLEQFKQQNDKKILEEITPAFVSKWVRPEHRYNPRIVFAVRIKMIIVLTGNDSKRTNFILREVSEKLFNKHLQEFVQLLFIPNLTQLISACSQMLPHIIFSPHKIADPFNEVLKVFHTTFFDNMIAHKNNNLSRFEKLKLFYKNDEDFQKRLRYYKDKITAILKQKNTAEGCVDFLNNDNDLQKTLNTIITAIADIQITSHTFLPESATQIQDD